ncbi:hypothetical protein EON82_23980, partial [bacterium]
MKQTSRLALILVSSLAFAGPALAQVPDLLNALDAGGRSMSMGGGNNATNVDTLASFYNPAALGYLDTREVGLAYRNLPSSRTVLSGGRANPDQNTDASSGSRSITHAGFAAPVRDLFGRGSGTIGISYTVGGSIDDDARATTLTDGPLTLRNYRLRREAKSSFYSLSYGKAVNNGLSYGAGLVIASQKVSYSETANAFDAANTEVPFGSVDASSTGSGIGVIAGALYTPTTAPSWTFGASVRTPINLSGNGETSSEYDKIPGRVLLGATWRREGFRGGKDYLLLGGQIQHFFGGESSRFFDRSSQTLFGLGAEYNLGIESGRVPLRVGFIQIPSGGDGFGDRNAFTFGVGYRPNRVPVGLDLSWAVPENGGFDFS